MAGSMKDKFGKPVTVWKARRRTRHDQQEILCGRMVGDKYVCADLIAVVPAEGTRYWTLESDPELEGSMTWLRAGLTDEGSPGEYRWSRWALDKIANAAEPGFRRRGSEPRVVTAFPATAPCLHGHQNAIDSNLVWVTTRSSRGLD